MLLRWKNEKISCACVCVLWDNRLSYSIVNFVSMLISRYNFSLWSNFHMMTVANKTLLKFLVDLAFFEILFSRFFDQVALI